MKILGEKLLLAWKSMNPFISLPLLISHLSRINQNLSLNLKQLLLADHCELLSHPALQSSLARPGGEFCDSQLMFLGFSAKTWGSFRFVWRLWGLALLSALPTSQISPPASTRDSRDQTGTQGREKIFNHLHPTKKSCSFEKGGPGIEHRCEKGWG